ncbi:methyl-accepting chemotaxis protein [Marinobacterium sp. D7]|uniref:methyl-accepting chemotaxis protein n=1 Tax=Marinobacterium ramblicola TaxID=2849041 RepID=UPI001C2D2918|nr:methyl-accepting chemotaxis protein [Marinobacterium ramblicola]MBV1788393.1 methyl-accepting chemotaxis protein [Marinobacterium ramblicola]
MKNSSLIKRFSVLTGLLSLIMFFELALVIVGVDKIEALAKSLNAREIPVLDKAHQLKISVVQVQQWLTDISATRGQDGLNDGFDLAQEYADKFKKLIDDLIRIDPENEGKYREMLPLFDAYYSTGIQMARLYVDRGPEAGNRMMGQFDETAERLSDKVDTFVAESQHHAVYLGDLQRQYMIWGEFAIIGGIIMLQIALGFIFWMMARALRLLPQVVAEFNSIAEGDLTSTRVISEGDDEVGLLSRGFEGMRNQLREALGSVSQSSSQVHHAAQEMTEYTEQTLSAIDNQRREIESVASAITEMSAAAHQIAGSAEEAAASAQQADDEARAGAEVVRRAVRTIEELVCKVIEAADVIAGLEQDSESIGGVLDVIRGVAEQTNLLALNAAIEAARAGEQGRGFAVVADEVRSLASRAQDSTAEIQEIIEKLQKGARNAVQAIELGRAMTEESIAQTSRASESLMTIEQAVARINEMTAQIASASEEQSAVSGEVAESINQISLVSERTAQGARETSDAGRGLVELADRLQGVVAGFKLQ